MIGPSYVVYWLLLAGVVILAAVGWWGLLTRGRQVDALQGRLAGAALQLDSSIAEAMAAAAEKLARIEETTAARERQLAERHAAELAALTAKRAGVERRVVERVAQVERLPAPERTAQIIELLDAGDVACLDDGSCQLGSEAAAAMVQRLVTAEAEPDRQALAVEETWAEADWKCGRRLLAEGRRAAREIAQERLRVETITARLTWQTTRADAYEERARAATPWYADPRTWMTVAGVAAIAAGSGYIGGRIDAH